LFLALALDYGHELEIPAFNDNTDLEPLMVDVNVAMLPLDTLHKYLGTLVKVKGDKWRSFEIKIKTLIAAPHLFAMTPLLSRGAQNPLVITFLHNSTPRNTLDQMLQPLMVD
jgi:hypothetical protein